MTTGSICAVPGVYASQCCRAEARIRMGEKKPRCPACGKATVWDFVRTTDRADEPRAGTPVPEPGEAPPAPG